MCCGSVPVIEAPDVTRADFHALAQGLARLCAASSGACRSSRVITSPTPPLAERTGGIARHHECADEMIAPAFSARTRPRLGL